MYSIFFSKIEIGIDNASEKIRNIVNNSDKVLILPWAFPNELDEEKFDNDYFKKGERRYNKYLDALMKMGIKEENVKVANCYSDSTEKLRKLIKESNVLLLPGGNPEMFFKKVTHDTEILYDIKKYKGIIIGESAGTELQLTRYFITAKNNYYKYFAFYDGFGVLKDPFYIDVHTTNNKNYLSKLQKISNDTNKDLYAIYDDGCIIYNRKNKDISFCGKIKKFIPKEK